MYAGKQTGMWGRYIDLWDTSDAMMEPDKTISYWFFFDLRHRPEKCEI